MLFLSNAAIHYAVDICLEKDKYKVGIAVKGFEKRDSVRQQILDMVAGSDCVGHIRNSNYNFEVQFKNGSRIKLILASDNSRGNKLHLLIVDREISIDIVECVLKRCELLDWMEYRYEQIGV